MKWRVNCVCLVGSATGIISFFMVWDFLLIHWGILSVGDIPYFFPRRYEPVTLIDMAKMSGSIGFYALLFVIGTIATIITPLGSALQTFGILSYVFMDRGSSSQIAVESAPISWTLGFTLGVLSTILVAYSIRRPRWTAFDRGDAPKSRRTIFDVLLTFSPRRNRVTECSD